MNLSTINNEIKHQDKPIVLASEKALDTAIYLVETAKKILLKKLDFEACPNHYQLFSAINNALHQIKEWQEPGYLEKKWQEFARARLVCNRCDFKASPSDEEVVSVDSICPHCNEKLVFNVS